MRRDRPLIDDDPTELANAPATPAEDDDEITSATVPPPPAKPLDAELAPGTMVGDYRIEGTIGRGGMGLVFVAVHPRIGKRVAIKVLRAELSRDIGAVERFEDEARVVNQIAHPNIVDIFTFGELADGRHYMVMEWLQGETLRARLARGRAAPTEVAAILRPLARALHAAHATGVVHRDLKPDNVFLVHFRDEVTVKLLDFGIAKLANTDHRVEMTASGVIVGTPQYLAPEQARGERVDARADVYSLGGIAFEMLTGRPPYIGGTALEVVAMHLMEPTKPPSVFIAGIPEELDALVFAMLAKDAAQRPPLGTVLDVLDRVAAGASSDSIPAPPQRNLVPVTAPSSPVVTAPSSAVVAAQTLSSSRRRRTSWLVAGTLLAIAGAGGAFAIARRGSSHDGSAETRPPTAVGSTSEPTEDGPAPAEPARPASASTASERPASAIENAGSASAGSNATPASVTKRDTPTNDTATRPTTPPTRPPRKRTKNRANTDVGSDTRIGIGDANRDTNANQTSTASGSGSATKPNPKLLEPGSLGKP